MKKIIFVLVICSIFLIGCESRNVVINYEGKNQNWDVSYKIDGNEESHDGYYTFKYIGTDDKPVSEIKYLIDGPKEGEDGKFSLNNTNEYTGKMRTTGGIPSISDRAIRVKIEWSGKTETVMLNRRD